MKKHNDLSRRIFPLLAALLAGTTAILWAQQKTGKGVITKEMQAKMTVEDIVAELKKGNANYVAGNLTNRDLQAQIQMTASGQNPAGVVLACIDSRVLPEIIFDVDIGDVFDARVAGNVVNEDIAGSMEYACAKAGSKLVLVLGHTGCGAVKGAIDGVELGNLTGLLAKIKPAIEAVKGFEGERSSKNKDFVKAVVVKNVELTIDKIREISPVLKKLESDSKIAIEGAVYDVATGKVKFLSK